MGLQALDLLAVLGVLLAQILAMVHSWEVRGWCFWVARGLFFPKFLKIIMINFSRFLALLNPSFWSRWCQFGFFGGGVHFSLQGLLHSPLRKIYFFFGGVKLKTEWAALPP